LRRYFSYRSGLLIAFFSLVALATIAAQSNSLLSTYSSALRRYPYLTDTVSNYATINWGTDRSETSGAIRFGKVGSESCTAHYVPATKTPISVNGVLEYQWKAMLNLAPGTQYCYRVYLGTSPLNEIDLLGSDSSPSFWTQIPSGGNQSYSFLVFGDWGMVDSSGANSNQASLMSLIAASGARFAVTTGDNGYPDGNQKNLGDLIQTGLNTSAVFGPAFWKVPGSALPLFPTIGNHGFNSSDINHPHIITWPQDRAVVTSGGRYIKETYCCLDGTASKSYPSAWYAFDAGPARFYVLNAAWEEVNVGTASEYQVDYDYHWAPGTPQYQWLQADLAAHPSVLKFAFLHYPLYSDNPNEPTDTFLLGSNSVEGLLKQNGVDLAFTGHSHIYERNLASAAGVPNYITGGGGATIGTLGTCTALDAYAIKFTTTGKACGSAPVPTSAGQVFHFLQVTVNGHNVTVTPINALGQHFDVMNYSFSSGAETTPPTAPTNLTATVVSGTQIDLSWSASSDNSGVRGYGIYRNGTLIGTTDQGSRVFSDTNLELATTYSYQVDAFDGSANHSSLSASQSATSAGSATFTFGPVADAYVAGDLTSSNFGTSSLLKADGSPTYRSYMRFNVSDLDGTVTSATLRIFATSGSTTGFQVSRLLNQNWDEGSISYNNAPAPGAVLASSGGFTPGSWVSLNVTSFVNASGVYDLVLTTSSSTVMNFNSRDASSNKPQLVIQTSTSGVTSTPSRTPTSTRTPTRTPTASPTATIPGTLTFNASADARVNEAAPTTNYGTATTLQVDGDAGLALRSFIRFTASGISQPVQSAKLRVFCTTNGTANGPAVYLAANNWTESGTGGITWNTQPALLSGVVDNTGAIGTNVWVEYDVTSFVTGNGTYSFALLPDGNDGVTFSSREGGTPPQLFIKTGTGVALATPTLASTPTAVPTGTAAPTVTPTPTVPVVSTDMVTPSRTPTNIPVQTNTPTETPTAPVSGGSTPTETFTVTATTSSGTALTFTTVADARVNQASPTSNYGTGTTLQVDGDSGIALVSYIRFTVSGISGSIQSVKLRVFCTTNGTINGPAVYLADSNWTESGAAGINWNSQPALSSGAFDNKGAIATASWVEYDVTALVTGNGTYTFALIADGNDGVTFSSREGGTPPQLVIEQGP